MAAGGAARGRDFRVAKRYKDWMIEIGFVNVVEKIILVPVNQWPINTRDSWLGKWLSMDVLKFLGSSKKLLHAGGMLEDQMDGFLEEVRRSAFDVGLRGYVPRKSWPRREPVLWDSRALLLTVSRLCGVRPEAAALPLNEHGVLQVIYVPKHVPPVPRCQVFQISDVPWVLNSMIEHREMGMVWHAFPRIGQSALGTWSALESWVRTGDKVYLCATASLERPRISA